MAQPALDWMLQNPQVSDRALIEALIEAHYEGLYRLAVFASAPAVRARQV